MGKEVEVKQKKKNKKEKEKTPVPEPKEEIVLVKSIEDEDCVDSNTVIETRTNVDEMFEEFVKEEISYADDFSPDKDLVEFSEEEKIIEIHDNDDSEKVEFFIREKSSSVESDVIDSSTMVDPCAAKPNPWFNKFLQKSSSLIEDQIFGAAKKYEDNTEDRNEDDDDMMELEKNQYKVETNIAALLEDDEAIEKSKQPEKTSSSLSTILKLDPKPLNQTDMYSSDDDLIFKPVPNKRNKKKQKQRSNEDPELDSNCPADSESEKLSEFEETKSSQSKSKGSKDGWSFEIDEEDVNKLLESDSIKDATDDVEERTALEDVFRFDSEMTHDDTEDKACLIANSAPRKNVSVEDLNDALIDETDDSEAEGITIRRRKESSDNEEYKECRGGATSGSCLSSSCPDTTDASESSVSNSPNPRQTKSKGKKGKKKKR